MAEIGSPTQHERDQAAEVLIRAPRESLGVFLDILCWRLDLLTLSDLRDAMVEAEVGNSPATDRRAMLRKIRKALARIAHELDQSEPEEVPDDA